MKRIVIFRFHKHPKVCLNRLKLIKKQNPKIKIYGVYGGKKSELPNFKKICRNHLENIFVIKNKSSYWKWKNFDLALRDWYKNVGHKIVFDTAHIIEWDLIFTDSLNKVYGHIKKEEIGLTGLITLSKVETHWSWTSKEPYKSEWYKLLRHVKKKYGYSKKPYASLGPGCCLPKSFLKKYSNEKIPELCHDELRIPLYAQVFGIKCKDTHFYKKWMDKTEKKYFNCVNKEIDIEKIKQGFKNHQRKAYHPYRKILNPKKPIINNIPLNIVKTIL